MHSCTTNHKNINRSKTYKRSKRTHGPLPFLYNFNVSILESVTILCSLENYGSRLRQLMYASWKLDKTNVGLRILEDSRKRYCSRFRQGYGSRSTKLWSGGEGLHNRETTVRIPENTMPVNSFVNCCPLFTSTKYKKRKRILVF